MSAAGARGGDADEERRGIAYGLSAYGIWGFLPLFFALLHHVRPTEIVAQRILWSVPLLLTLVVLRGRTAMLRRAIGNPRALTILLATAMLIAANWLIYIWAIGAHHVLETSLGYFLNPLVNVIMAVALLKERLRRVQTIAVALAGFGVAIFALGASTGLWISLSLALTFATYGLLRKIAPVEALEGLMIETSLLAPIALGYLVWLGSQGRLAIGQDFGTTALLVCSGVVTAVPLLLFSAGARRLRYSTLGLLQYVAPTIQFLLAVLVFGESLTIPHMLCFAFIWFGLALYAADGLRGSTATA